MGSEEWETVLSRDFRLREEAAARLSALRALRDAVGKYIADPDAWDHALKDAYAKVAELEKKGGERE